MPYINPHARESIDIEVRGAETAGELNYAISRLLVKYISEQGLGYTTIADCMSACEGAKAEFYRRVAGPYEDLAIERNGDVYPDEMTQQHTS